MKWCVLVLAACGRLDFDGRSDAGSTIDVPFFAEDGGVDPICGTVLTPTQVAIGAAHVCVIVSSGGLLCWGANNVGQLGTGDNAARSTPTPIDAPTWTAIAAHGNHTCGLKAGFLYCWGANTFGQLGIGNEVPQNLPQLVTGNWSSVAAGGEHTCARSGSELYCWGKNDRGQLGLGDQVARNTPAMLATLMWGGTAYAGDEYSCAIVREGVPFGLRCWGANEHGQLGVDTTDQLTPRGTACCDYAPVLGGAHTIARHAGPNASVIGKNQNGQLGLGDTVDRMAMTALPGTIFAVAAGTAHSCMLEVGTGTVSCFGANDRGQLGLGAPGPDQRVPRNITEETFSDVWAGGRMTCATKSDGRFYCWGANDTGQLGLGHTVQRSRPIQVCL